MTASPGRTPAAAIDFTAAVTSDRISAAILLPSRMVADIGCRKWNSSTRPVSCRPSRPRLGGQARAPASTFEDALREDALRGCAATPGTQASPPSRCLLQQTLALDRERPEAP